MRFGIKCLLAGSLLCVPIVASCVFGPTGSNTATGIYPSPNAQGQIALTYLPQNSATTTVTFVFDSDDTLKIADDASPDDGFTAVVDVTKLTPGAYPITATEDGGEVGHLTLLVPLGSGSDGTAGSTSATGTAAASGASGT